MNTRLMVRPCPDVRILDTYWHQGNLGLVITPEDLVHIKLGDKVSLDFDNKTVNPSYNTLVTVTGILNVSQTNGLTVIATNLAFGSSTVNETGWITNILRENKHPSSNFEIHNAGHTATNGVYQYMGMTDSSYAGHTGTGPWYLNENNMTVIWTQGLGYVVYDSDMNAYYSQNCYDGNSCKNGSPCIGGVWIAQEPFGIEPLPLTLCSSRSVRFQPKEFDLKEDLQFPITYQISDIKNPQSRKTDFTKQITLPGTKTNSQLLDEMFTPEISPSWTSYRKRDCWVIQDGLEILNGSIRYDGADRDDWNSVDYRVSVLGKTADLFADLKKGDGTDLYLHDLDFSKYDHLWDRDNIMDSWRNYNYVDGVRTLMGTQGTPYTVSSVQGAPNSRTEIMLSAPHDLVFGDVIEFYGGTSSYVGHHTVTSVTPSSVIVNSRFTETTTGQIRKVEVSGKGYVYPFVDRGIQDLSAVSETDMQPRYFIKEYFDEIFKYAGYTYDSQFLESQTFKRLLLDGHAMPQTALGSFAGFNTYMYKSTTQDIIDTSGPTGTNNIIRLADLTSYDYDGTVGTPPYGVFTLGSGTTAGRYTVTDNSSIVRITAGVQLAITITDITVPPGASNPRLNRIRINYAPALWKYNALTGVHSNVASQHHLYINEDNVGISLTPGAVQNIVADIPPIQLTFEDTSTNVGDYFYMRVALNMQIRNPDGVWTPSGYTNYGTSNFSRSPAIVSQGVLDQTVSATVGIAILESFISPETSGNEIVANSVVVKDLKAKDFLMSVFNAFNMYVEPSRNKDKHLTIEPHDIYYSQDVVDWTDKVDMSQEISVDPSSRSIADTLSYSYSEDGDRFNLQYKNSFQRVSGDYILDRDDDFASGESKIQLSFAPTVMVDWDQNDVVIPTILKQVDTGEKVAPDNYKPRMLWWQGVRSVSQFSIDGTSTGNQYDIGPGATATYGRPVYGYAGVSDNPLDQTLDLNFGPLMPNSYQYGYTGFRITENNLYNKYYRSWLEELTSNDSRLVTFKMKLSSKDLYDLSFRKIYQIKNVNYKLQKISDYDPLTEAPCTVQFLKARRILPWQDQAVGTASSASNSSLGF